MVKYGYFKSFQVLYHDIHHYDCVKLHVALLMLCCEHCRDLKLQTTKSIQITAPNDYFLITD